MIYYKDLIEPQSSQIEAQQLLRKLIEANGSEPKYMKVLDEKRIKLLSGKDYSNNLYTKGVFAVAYMVDCMECAFTKIYEEGGSMQIVIHLKTGYTWDQFIHELKNLNNEQ